MITRVSGVNTKGVTGGLRQNENRTSFMHSSSPTVKYDFAPVNNNQQQQQPAKSPIWTGTSIVLGSVLFMILYFLISGSKRA